MLTTLLSLLALGAVPLLDDVIAAGDLDARRDLLQAALADAADREERSVVASALVIVEALGDERPPATVRAYLEAVWAGDAASREFAVKAAKAGGALTADGRPEIVATVIPESERIGAPPPGHPKHAAYERYVAEHLRMVCDVSLHPSWATNTFQYVDDSTWGVLRGDGAPIPRDQLTVLFLRGGVDHEVTCWNDNRKRVCGGLAEAEALVERYNQALRDHLELAEGAVLHLDVEEGHPGYKDCVTQANGGMPDRPWWVRKNRRKMQIDLGAEPEELER